MLIVGKLIWKEIKQMLYLQSFIPSGWKIPEPAHRMMGLFF